MRRLAGRGALTLCLVFQASVSAVGAEQVYLPPDEFLDTYLPGCRQQFLWLTRETRAQVENLIERPFPGVRVRYCGAGGKTAWILDEIGKTEPITTGIVVNQGKVERVRVLIYRESRGGEVRRERFMQQYRGARLVDEDALDRSIDGITGATLSVRAVSRQVRLALLLDHLVAEQSRGG